MDFEILTLRDFEIKEIWEPQAIVSLYGLEGLGLRVNPEPQILNRISMGWLVADLPAGSMQTISRDGIARDV